MTITLSDLKFPSGEFSHTELAEFNGLDRKKVWTAYQKAITEKIIESTGNERKSGKGKAATLWRVIDASKVTVSTDGVPFAVTPVVSTTPAPEVAAKPSKKPKAEKPVVESGLEAPAIAPVVVAEVVEVKPVVLTEPKPEDLKVCIQPAGLGEISPIEDKCPFCQNPLVSARTNNGGIRVWCPINDLRICSCSENPYGYSNNIKNAVEILLSKFKTSRA